MGFSFDPRQAFFLLDSEHLDRISSHFYGFTIQNGTITSAPAAPLTGDGAYVDIRRDGDTVTITQDFMGSYGLYLFEAEDYFALSNSFPLLVDHVKRRFPITLNREYADYFLCADLCSAAFSETMVREIRLLDRAAVVSICIPGKKLSLSTVDYSENTLYPDTAEGMAQLDAWFGKWAALIRNLKAKTNNIQTDLSGGFDSRLVFSLLLGSKVDLKDVFIFSYDDDLHTHREDFTIATAMGNRFGFQLNDHHLLTPGMAVETEREILDISLYTKQSFHKQMYLQTRYYDRPRYNFVGNGGECVRDYWNMSQEEFIRRAQNRANTFPQQIQSRMRRSVGQILERSFDDLKEKFHQLGRPLEEDDLTLHLYRETRCRNHFGKAIVERYLAGSVTCAPLLDPMLHRLKRCGQDHSDNNLLAAIIYSRFGADLLDFPFDGSRAIAPETISLARQLNEQFPLSVEVPDTPIPAPVEDLPEKPESIPVSQIHDNVMGTLGSRSVQRHLQVLFGKGVCDYITKDIQNRKFHPLQMAFAAISAAWIAREEELSLELAPPTLAESFFRHHLPEEQPIPDTLMGHKNLEDLIAARIDLKQDGGDVQIRSATDPAAKISYPDWFRANGQGAVIDSMAGEITIRFSCTGEAPVELILRGRAVKDAEGNRIPYFVDYTDVSIDGVRELTQPTPVCHDLPLKFSLESQPGQEHTLRLAWEPHSESRRRMLQRIPPAPKPEPPKEAPKKKSFWR